MHTVGLNALVGIVLDRTLALYRRLADPRAELVKANGSGLTAAVLPTGIRAVSTEI
jgi:hypothetical protein